MSKHIKIIIKRIQPKSFKLLTRRMSKLRQEFAILKHYWKIRCRERKTLKFSISKATGLLNHLEKREKDFCKVLNRRRFVVNPNPKNRKEPRYILMLTSNEILKLRLYLNRSHLHDKRSFDRDNLKPPYLTKSQRSKLYRLLKLERS